MNHASIGRKIGVRNLVVQFCCTRFLPITLFVFGVACWPLLGLYGQDMRRNPQIPHRDTSSHYAGVQELLKLQREKAEPTIFAASRQAQKITEAPFNIYLITDADIQIRGYLSLKDILEDIPEFKFDEYGDRAHYNVVNTRGVRGQEKFIIMLDGVRISSPTNDPIPITENYPIRNVKQIEIVTAPASAIYGADAMMGVINIIPFTADDGKHVRGAIYGGMYNYLSADACITHKIRKVDFRLSGQYNYDGQPRFPDFYKTDEYDGLGSLQTGVYPNTIFGPQQPRTSINSEYSVSRSSHNWEASATYQNLNISVHQNSATTPTSITSNAQNAVYNSDAFLRNTTTKFSANYRKTIGKVYNQTLVSYSIYELDPESNYRNVFSGMERGYKFGFGSMYQLDQLNSFNIIEHLNVSVGLNIQSFFALPWGDDLDRVVNPNFQMDANLLGAPIPTQFVQLKYQNYGSFLQFVYRPLQNLSITVGARYDYNTRFHAVFNPRIGISYRPTKVQTVKLFYGTSFLAPSPWASSQKYGSFFSTDSGRTYQSAFYQVPNMNLDPIQIQCLEASYHLDLQTFGLHVVAYHHWVQGVYYDNVTPNANQQVYGWNVVNIQQTINTENQVNYGISFMADKSFRLGQKAEWKWLAGFGFMDGQLNELDPDGGRITGQAAYISPFQYRLSHELRWGKFQFHTRMIAMSDQRTKVLESEIDPEHQEHREVIPGYFVLHLNAGYALTKQLRLSVQIQNLTNTRYRNVNSKAFQDGSEMRGTPQMPFRLIVGLQSTF
jgi:outer membrane receptor for ferrienterochelin and colicin